MAIVLENWPCLICVYIASCIDLQAGRQRVAIGQSLIQPYLLGKEYEMEETCFRGLCFGKPPQRLTPGLGQPLRQPINWWHAMGGELERNYLEGDCC